MYDEITKPNREPDFISDRGTSYFWFSELIYMDVHSKFYRIERDEIDGALVLAGSSKKPRCPGCARCLEQKVCNRYTFKNLVQDAFRYWDSGEIEKLLGLSDG